MLLAWKKQKISANTVHSSSEEFALIAMSTSNFFAVVASVSDLSLDFATLMYLPQDAVSCALRVQLPRLRSLHLDETNSCLGERVFAAFCCLLRSMPILESIEIKCCYHQVEPDAFSLNECMKKEDSISCLEQNLRQLTISVTKTISSLVMGMMRFIMLNANLLKLVEIKYMEDSKVEPSVVEKLNLVQKASLNVKVVFSSKSARR